MTHSTILLQFIQQLEIYKQALDNNAKALIIYEKSNVEDHPSAADTLNNIASVIQQQGNYRDALDNFSKALVIKQKVYGEDYPSTADTLNNIASVNSATINLQASSG